MVVSVTSDDEASDVCESGYTVVVVTPEPTTVVEVGSGVGGRRLMPLESCAAAAERVLPARPTRSADGRISECKGCSTCFVGSTRCFKRASGRQQENSSWAKFGQSNRTSGRIKYYGDVGGRKEEEAHGKGIQRDEYMNCGCHIEDIDRAISAKPVWVYSRRTRPSCQPGSTEGFPIKLPVMRKLRTIWVTDDDSNKGLSI